MKKILAVLAVLNLAGAGRALLMAPSSPPDVADGELIQAAPSAEAPALITEEEVVFGTAAAVPEPRITRTRRFFSALGRAMAPPPPRRHYPARYAYLENALMSREMDRL